MASERVFSSVYSHVVIKVYFFLESFSTLLTNKRPFSCMNFHVGFKASMLINSFHTEGMNLVSLQCEFSCAC